MNNESVILVPSITLWSTPEMIDMAREYLTSREIILIHDTDAMEERNQ